MRLLYLCIEKRFPISFIAKFKKIDGIVVFFQDTYVLIYMLRNNTDHQFIKCLDTNRLCNELFLNH